MKFTSLLFCLLLPFLSFAQLQDDFSDGNFTDNPTWLGNTDKYIVNSAGELQLNDTEASGTSTSYLYTAATTAENTVWDFYIRQEFSPSTSNFARVYLKSDVADLTGNVNGYYVQIGGISGTDDAIELYRQDGSSRTVLITGTVAGAGGDPVIARIRVERDVAANWTLLVDYTGGTDYLNEGAAIDATYNMGGYFGWTCTYTTTRSDKFFMDDMSVNPIFVDMQAPQLLSAAGVSMTTVDVLFDEGIIDFDENNFTLDNGISVVSAIADGINPSLIHLEVSPNLQNFQTYTLTAENISDTGENVLTSATASFDFLIAEMAEAGDLIINEIMADPSPEVGLPNAEFIEIYNKSNKVIDLQTVSVSSDTSPDDLPSFLLTPNSYVVVCDDEDLTAFQTYGNAVAVSSFPSLSNTGDYIILATDSGVELDRVDYSDSWYNDANKNDGGWTLERIDALTSSNCSGNWRASQNAIGGTPAALNSVEGQFFDTQAPRLISVVPLSETAIMLTFSESLDAFEASETMNFTINPNIAITNADLQNPDNHLVLLNLDTPLQNGTVYELTTSNAIGDCLGNLAMDNQTKRFGLAETIEPLDVVINEVLFNPRTGGSDYLELYNRSEKIFTLSLSGSPLFQFFPGEYAVFSEEPDTILSRFNVENPDNLFLADLPPFNNDAGEIILTVGGVTIDTFMYAETQHYELLKDENGVALERINPDRPTNEEGNWHSAAATAGYGTPTAKNSQLLLTEIDPSVDFFQIPNPRVSPDEDGFEDVLVINYQFDQPGFSANVKVFDAQGRQVKELINNELMGVSGSIKWDGTTDATSRARVGIYVIWAEIFNPDGRVEIQKEVVVVAGQL